MKSSLAGIVASVLLVAGSSVAAAQKPDVVIFTGLVVDSTKKPLENAEIIFPALPKNTTTNDKGVFRFGDIPFGSHRVIVRRIGYGQMDTLITFDREQNVEWRVTLGRIVTLDSVIVSAPIDPLIAEFESNRARGFGRFMTRADLAKFDGASLPNVMAGLPGTAMTRPGLGMVFMTSKRQPTSGCRGTGASLNATAASAQQEAIDDCLRRERVYYVPDPVESRQGVPRACMPQVFVDRTLMNSGVPTMPFDLSTYATEQIEAIEWYESPSQTPPKYSQNNAKCGVLVLHLRKRK